MQHNPRRLHCLFPHYTAGSPEPVRSYSLAETARRGLFGAELTDYPVDGGAAGATVLLGYTGSRWAYWLGSQDVIVPPRSLPETAYVCSAGERVVLHSGPGGEWSGSVPSGTRVTATRFRLTRAGDPSGRPGAGWYRVTLPNGRTGWISSLHLADAAYAADAHPSWPSGPCGVWTWANS